MDPREVLQRKLEQTRRNYSARLPGRLAELRAALERWKRTGLPADLQEARLLAHRLGGSAGSHGWPETGRAALALEHLLRDALDGTPLGPRGLEEAWLALVGPGDPLPASPLPPGGGSEAPDAGRTVFLLDPEAGEELAEELGRLGFDTRRFDLADALQEALLREHPAAVLACHERLGPWSAPGVPLLLIARDPSFEARLGAVREGALGYFLRPVEAARIAERLEEVCVERPHEPWRVLVVDDEEAMASFARLVLEGSGMVVEALTDPLQVTSRLADFAPDLLLIDLHMPACSGLELAAVIRQQDAYVGLPITFLSAETRLDRRLEALAGGGDDFLLKPVAPEHLVTAVGSRARRARRLRALVQRDGLTGLLNYTAFRERLEAEAGRALRSGEPLSLAMLDLDRFKSVNDTHGHAAGDQVLRSLARGLAARLRQSDCAGRYGGEEFAILLPATPAETAAAMLDTLREAFAGIRHRARDSEFRVSLSCGVASLPPAATAADLAESADRALYQAKRDGRNRVARAWPA